jgi:hypothetical protein
VGSVVTYFKGIYLQKLRNITELLSQDILPPGLNPGLRNTKDEHNYSEPNLPLLLFLYLPCHEIKLVIVFQM